MRVLTGGELRLTTHIGANHNVVMDGGSFYASAGWAYSGVTHMKSDSYLNLLNLSGLIQDYDINHAGAVLHSANTLTLGGANNTYSGGTEVTGGRLTVTANNATGSGTVTISSGAELTYQGSISLLSPMVFDGGSLFTTAGWSLNAPIQLKSDSTIGYAYLLGTIANHASGAGKLTKTGSGTLDLAGDNTFTGGLEIAHGTVRLRNAGALNSTSPNAVAFAGNANIKELNIGGRNVMVSGLSTGATIGDTLVRNEPYITGGPYQRATLTVNLAIDQTYGGVLSDGLQSNQYGLEVVRTGSGTWTLTGNNDKLGAGTATGNQGRFRIDGGTVVAGHTNALGVSTITVNDGGTLAIESGVAFTRTVTFNSGSALGGSGSFARGAAWALPTSFKVRPGVGAATGTLTVSTAGGALTFGDGRALEIDFNGASADCLVLSGGGTLTLSGTTDKLVLRGTPKAGSYVIASAASVSGTFNVTDVTGLAVTGGKVVYEADRVLYVLPTPGTVIAVR